MALGTPVDGGAAYSASGGTSVTPAYPAGITAGDVLVLIVGQKPSTANGGTVTTPSGWTLRDSLTGAGGYGTTLGADTGNTNLFVYTKDTVTGSETGTLSVTLGTNGVAWAAIVRVPGSGGTLSYGTADGSRTTTPTSPMSIALTDGASATNFQAGDLALWAMCIPTDVTTPSQFSAQSITATGATFGTAVELEEPDSATGNDIGGYIAYASVTAGSSTTAPTVTSTLAGTLTNVRGPVVLLRIRETIAPVSHATSGALTGPGSTVTGLASSPEPLTSIGTGTSVFNTTGGSKTTSAFDGFVDHAAIVITTHTGNTASVAPTDNHPDGLGGSGGYTLITTAKKNSNADTLQVWVRNARFGSTSGMTVTHNPGSTTGGGLWVLTHIGGPNVGSAMIAQSGVVENQSSGSPISVTLPAIIESRNPVITVMFDDGTTNSTSPPTGMLRTAEALYTTPNSRRVGAYILDSWTDSSGNPTDTVTWVQTTTGTACGVALELVAYVGPVTHATTGALTGQIGSVTGTAAHEHVATGALTGPGATVAGTAARSAPPHATSGTLTGPGSAIVGAAPHNPVTHSTSGALPGTSSTLAAGRAGRNLSQPVIFLGSYADTNSGAKSVTVTAPAGSLPIVFTTHTSNSDNVAPTDNAGGTYVNLGGTAKPGFASLTWSYVRTTRVATTSSITITHTPTNTTTGGGLIVVALTEGTLAGSTAKTSEYGTSWDSNQFNPSATVKTTNYSDVVLALLWHDSATGLSGPTATGYSFKPLASTTYDTPTTGVFLAYSEYVNAAGTTSNATWSGTATGTSATESITFRTLNPHYATAALTGPGSTIAGTAARSVTVNHSTSGTLTGQGSTLSAARMGRNLSQPYVVLGSYVDSNSGSKAFTGTPPVGSLPIIVTYHTNNSDLSTAPTDNNAGGGGTYTLVGQTQPSNVNDGSLTSQMCIWARNNRITSATSTTFTHTPTGAASTTGGGVYVLALTEGTLAGSNVVAFGSSILNSNNKVNPTTTVQATNYSDLVMTVFVNGSTTALSGPTTSGYDWVSPGAITFTTPDAGAYIALTQYVALGTNYSGALWSGTATGQSGNVSATFRTLNPHYATGALTGQGSTVVGSANHTVTTAHVTNGNLAGPGAAVTGDANRTHVFATSGALAGQVATLAGSANRFITHETTGALPGQTATIAGTSVHNVPHVTTGALTGQLGSVAGSANRTHVFATSGVLAGQTATVAGTARHNIPHATTGALTGPGSAVAGTSARFRAFATTGALTGQASVVAGSANRTHVFATSGALTGQGSPIAGAAARTHVFDTAGALTAQGATVAGSAARSNGVVAHSTSGALPGQSSSVAGAAQHNVPHATAGALPGQIATASGSANRTRVHDASGAIAGPGTSIAGSADRFRTFDTAGALAGQASSISGVAIRFRAFDVSGDLVGPAGLVSGIAVHNITHSTSGALPGRSSAMTGIVGRTSESGFPSPSDVRLGVVYGPGGIFIGTMKNKGRILLRR